MKHSVCYLFGSSETSEISTRCPKKNKSSNAYRVRRRIYLIRAVIRGPQSVDKPTTHFILNENMKNIKKITTAVLMFFAASMTFARTTITMEKDGGVYKVPCVVNGLRMKFIFDTGAANVCISEVMAQYMLDNEYLSKTDVLGTGFSSVADGRIVDHVKIRLSYLEIGGLKLNNVEAIVIAGQSAPLLLGQSAIAQMGKVSINGNQLVIEDAGQCLDSDIDNWSHLADSYYDNRVYDKALLYYQKIDDCDRLSWYGVFVMGRCHVELKNYNEAIEIFQTLANGIDDNLKEYEPEYWAKVFGNIAYCYRLLGNHQACIAYDSKAFKYMVDWEYAVDKRFEMAMCYREMKDYDKADESAYKGIYCFLYNKYPKVFSEWERNNFKDLVGVLDKYRWGKEEILGNLLFIMCEDYYYTYDEPHCQLSRIAAEMGSPFAQAARRVWRSYGLCP